jgi:TonB family protein
MILGALLLAVSMQAPPASMTTDLTGGNEQLKLGEAAPAGSPEQRRLFENAVSEFRRIEAEADAAAMKMSALEKLALLYDSRHLNDPPLAEMVLRELSTFAPDDLTLLFRLSRIQEEHQEIDNAENTLLYARHTQPAEIEPNRMLAEFYTRRVAEVPAALPQTGVFLPPVSPGAPDKDGFYYAGGALPAPRRLDIPQYPKEAQDSGLQGTILIEVSLNEAGVMTGARVLRSVPLLDEAALDAVRNWHYGPTLVDGRAVPVKLVVTVFFSLRP